MDECDIVSGGKFTVTSVSEEVDENGNIVYIGHLTRSNSSPVTVVGTLDGLAGGFSVTDSGQLNLGVGIGGASATNTAQNDSGLVVGTALPDFKNLLSGKTPVTWRNVRAALQGFSVMLWFGPPLTWEEQQEVYAGYFD